MQPPSKTQLNRQTLIGWLQQEFHPSRLIPSLTAALITGTIEVIYAISFAALIFSGDLAPYISTGIGLALFTSIAISLILALGSSSPGIVSGTQEAPAIILGVMAAAITAQFSAAALTGEVLPTIIVALALTSILTGIGCFLLGQFKLGSLIRFIPYPVVGGFLAGTGWLLLLGSLSFMTDLSLPGEQFLQLLQPQILLQWVPGCSFGILLLVLLRRYHHFLLMPGLVVGAIILFYVALFATHTSISEAQAAGLLLKSFPSGSLWQPLSLSTLAQANGGFILSQLGQMVAVMLITVISILLNATGIELAIEQDLDLNRELRVTGVANLVSGLGGGIGGFHALGLSILSYRQLGARSRMVGVFIAAGMAIILFAGASIISLFPKPVLGGVTLLLGLDLLVEWVYDAWFKLSKTDYFIVLLILFVVATVGFLEGVGVGLAVAIALFVINYSQVKVTKHILSGATYQSQAARSFQQRRLLQAEGDQTYILELQGFLFFGTANKLLNQIRQRLRHPDLPPLKFIALSFRAVTGLDSSAVLSFTKLQQIAQQQQLSLVFTNLLPQIQRQFQQGGVLRAEDPACQLFPDLDRGLEWCENKILGEVPLRRSRSLPLVLQLNDLFPNANHASEFMDYLEEWDADPGAIVFQQNQPADAIYLIEVGQVTVYWEQQQGQTHRIQSLGAGNLVGELDFFRSSTHQTSAIVDAPSTLYRLSTASFHQMQQEKPEVATAFQSAVIQILGDRLTHAYKEISDLLRS
jgi:sulfate permease, SulP family